MTSEPEGRAMTMTEINAQLRARRCTQACSEQHTYVAPCQATAAPTLRDRAIDAVAQALNTGQYWLPAAGQAAAVDAVLALTDRDLEASQRRAVAVVERIDAARAWARQHLDAEQQAGLFGAFRGDQPEMSPEAIEPDHVLHAERRHPGWEYATTEGPRKQWDDINVPPCDYMGVPQPGWERNFDAGRPGEGWDRFDYTEESYWRRRKTEAPDA